MRDKQQNLCFIYSRRILIHNILFNTIYYIFTFIYSNINLYLLIMIGIFIIKHPDPKKYPPKKNITINYQQQKQHQLSTYYNNSKGHITLRSSLRDLKMEYLSHVPLISSKTFTFQ